MWGILEELKTYLPTVVAENENEKKSFQGSFPTSSGPDHLGPRQVNSGRGERRQAEAAIAAGEVETKGG